MPALLTYRIREVNPSSVDFCNNALPVSARDWLLIAGLSMSTALLPRFLYALCAPIVGTARTAAAGSVELPTMILVGALAYGERIGPLEWAACGLIVAAVVLTPSKVTRNVSASITRPRREG